LQDYDEFVTQLYKMKNEDSHTLLVFTKCYVSIIHSEVRAEMEALKVQMETLKAHTEILKLHTALLARGGGGGGATNIFANVRHPQHNEGMELKKGTDQISQGAMYAERMSKCEEAVRHLCERLMVEMSNSPAEQERTTEQSLATQLSGFPLQRDAADRDQYLPIWSPSDANAVQGSSSTTCC